MSWDVTVALQLQNDSLDSVKWQRRIRSHLRRAG